MPYCSLPGPCLQFARLELTKLAPDYQRRASAAARPSFVQEVAEKLRILLLRKTLASATPAISLATLLQLTVPHLHQLRHLG
jgi:hypothetical protein